MNRLIILTFICASVLSAQPSNGQPLTSLPYTPSLDVSAMDRMVDPCVDFYRYSCANWIRKNPIPPDQARWDVYAKLTDENQRYLWGLLQQAAEPSAHRGAVEQKIGDFFGACMDQAAIDRAGSAPLRSTLDRVEALRSTAQLAPVLARLQLESPGRGPLFGFGSNQDFSDSSRVIAFASAGGLGLPDRDYYLKTDPKSVQTRAKYLAHVAKMFELLGDSPTAARAEAQTVMEIETALAKSSLTRVERRDPYKLFHMMTRAQLVALTPAFDWNAYLAASGAGGLSEFNVTEPAFFKELETLLASHKLDDWKTYLRWNVVHSEAPYLSTPFVTANFDFYSAYLRGTKQLEPRWKRCVQYTDRNLGEALGQVFVEKTFSADTKARVLAMTKEIQKAMEQEIDGLTWMGPETKKRALEKLHLMVDKIGYPDKWRDYSKLEIRRGDFIGNIERSAEFESRRDLAKIGKPVDRGEWQMSPPTVNAYYDPQMNDINFPAGVLQPPLYDPKMDDAPNYGNTGATIGHELTHGFDDEGRQFDAHGNLKDWWTKKDGEAFVSRAACVVDQYAGYTVIDNIKINSKLTEGEDVADLGGTLLAYIAWKSSTHGEQLHPIDGLTPDQRFFVGMAQWACGEERPEAKRVNAMTDPHSPNEYRINGVVSNMPEFSKAFACKAGQPMVRANACRVW
jgi:putative endopeptidase